MSTNLKPLTLECRVATSYLLTVKPLNLEICKEDLTQLAQGYRAIKSWLCYLAIHRRCLAYARSGYPLDLCELAAVRDFLKEGSNLLPPPPAMQPRQSHVVKHPVPIPHVRNLL